MMGLDFMINLVGTQILALEIGILNKKRIADFKFYLISFFAVSIIALIYVYLQHMQILPQRIRTGPFYYSFKNDSEFITALIYTTIFLYLVPVGIKVGKNRKTSIICPKCEQSEEVLKQNAEARICPICNIKMVPLEGFYDKKTDSTDKG